MTRKLSYHSPSEQFRNLHTKKRIKNSYIEKSKKVITIRLDKANIDYLKKYLLNLIFRIKR